MKKIIYSIAVFILIAVVFLNRNPNIARAFGNFIRTGRDVSTGTLAMRTSSSTTTPAYIQNGTSTSTLTFASENYSGLSVFIQYAASTTNTRSPLQVTVQQSDDNIDFWNVDFTQVDHTKKYASGSAVTLATTTVPFTLLTSDATTTRLFTIPILPARFTRLLFDLASTTPGVVKDGGTIWANVNGIIPNGY